MTDVTVIALGVHVLGPIHGVLFLGYVVLALEARRRLQWDGRTLLVVLAEASYRYVERPLRAKLSGKRAAPVVPAFDSPAAVLPGTV